MVARRGDHRRRARLSELWDQGRGPWPAQGEDPGSAHGRAPGGVGVAKRIWHCGDGDCPATTWSETSPAVGARAALSERARAEICRRVGEDGDSVAQVARDFGVGWFTAMAAVKDHGTPLVDDPTRLEGTRALGLDETKYLSATRTHHTQYVTSSGWYDFRKT